MQEIGAGLDTVIVASEEGPRVGPDNRLKHPLYRVETETALTRTVHDGEGLALPFRTTISSEALWTMTLDEIEALCPWMTSGEHRLMGVHYAVDFQEKCLKRKKSIHRNMFSPPVAKIGYLMERQERWFRRKQRGQVGTIFSGPGTNGATVTHGNRSSSYSYCFYNKTALDERCSSVIQRYIPSYVGMKKDWLCHWCGEVFDSGPQRDCPACGKKGGVLPYPILRAEARAPARYLKNERWGNLWEWRRRHVEKFQAAFNLPFRPYEQHGKPARQVVVPGQPFARLELLLAKRRKLDEQIAVLNGEFGWFSVEPRAETVLAGAPVETRCSALRRGEGYGTDGLSPAKEGADGKLKRRRSRRSELEEEMRQISVRLAKQTAADAGAGEDEGG